jgi:hypothetical protein
MLPSLLVVDLSLRSPDPGQSVADFEEFAMDMEQFKEALLALMPAEDRLKGLTPEELDRLRQLLAAPER